MLVPVRPGLEIGVECQGIRRRQAGDLLCLLVPVHFDEPLPFLVGQAERHRRPHLHVPASVMQNVSTSPVAISSLSRRAFAIGTVLP